jgi:hypothetical protein
MLVEINVSKLLAVVIAHHEARFLFIDGPRRREAAELSLLHIGLFGLDRRTRDRAVRTEHTTIAGFWL